MPNTLTSIFTSSPATEPVEAPHPNTNAYVLGTQLANGTWQVVHTNVTKTATAPTMVGRLKNFPAVTASIVASGNVLNNVLATPTGTSATGTSTTAINVTVSSIANATAYRFFVSDTQTGTYVQLVQQASATYAHTGLAAGATKWYKIQYVGGGFYDDSALGAAFSGTAAAARRRAMIVLDGDSIATTGQSAGDWRPDYLAQLTSWLAGKTDAQLATAGLTAETPLLVTTSGGVEIPISGQTIQQMNSAAADIDAAYNAAFACILTTIGEPYNGTRTSTPPYTPQQSADAYNAYALNRKATGFMRVVSLVGFDDRGTGYTQPTGGYAAVRNAILAALDAQKTGSINSWDAIGKVDPLFDQTNAAMCTDGIHPLKAAYLTGNLLQRLIAALDQAVFGVAQPAAVSTAATIYSGVITFADNINQVNNSGIITAPSQAGGTWGAVGRCTNLKIAANTNGRILMDFPTATDAGYAIFGLSDVNVRMNYTDIRFKCGMWVVNYQGVNYTHTIQNGIQVDPTPNTFTNTATVFSIYRNGTAITFEYSTDGGSTWTVSRTFTFATAADLFIISDLNQLGTMKNPRGTGLTTY